MPSDSMHAGWNRARRGGHVLPLRRVASPIDLEPLARRALPGEHRARAQPERRQLFAPLADLRASAPARRRALSASRRSTCSTAPPPISASAATCPVTTGVPHAIASIDRQAEALVHRRKHEHLGQAVERRQIVERHVAGEPDRVARSAAARSGLRCRATASRTGPTQTS